MTTNEKINATRNLDELLDTLQSEAARCDLYSFKLEDVVQLDDLPTFGGDEPADTDCIWSWDADRLLVGEGEFEIVTRAAWDDAEGA